MEVDSEFIYVDLMDTAGEVLKTCWYCKVRQLSIRREPSPTKQL